MTAADPTPSPYWQELVAAARTAALADGDWHLRDLARLEKTREGRRRGPARPPWPLRADFELSPDGVLSVAAPVLTMQGEDL
ncbi:MAG: hypothetical protein ACYC1Z_03515 [Georgenia sp.]